MILLLAARAFTFTPSCAGASATLFTYCQIIFDVNAFNYWPLFTFRSLRPLLFPNRPVKCSIENMENNWKLYNAASTYHRMISFHFFQYYYFSVCPIIFHLRESVKKNSLHPLTKTGLGLSGKFTVFSRKKNENIMLKITKYAIKTCESGFHLKFRTLDPHPPSV